MDLGFFKERIILNTNYYRNRSSNQLLNYTLPNITGTGNIAQNLDATVQNTGWEFSLNVTAIKSNNFNWSAILNLTIPQNKLVAFKNLESSSYANTYVIGQPVNISKVLHFLGVDPNTGIAMVANAKGEPTTTPDFLKDPTQLINTNNKFFGGLQNTFSYKKLQLDVLFDFVKRISLTNFFGDMYPGSFFSYTSNSAYFAGNSTGNQPVTVLQRWQKPGDIARVEKYSSVFFGSSTPFYAAVSDIAYGDGSFVRLKNLSLSYTLPDNLTKKSGFKGFAYLYRARIY